MKKFGDRHLIFTLDQPYFQKPGYEGINSTSDLVDHLTSKGIPHHRTVGQYQDPEQGIHYKEDTVALKDPSDQDIKTHLDLAQKQGQESAILRHGDKWHMLYLNGPLAGKKLTAQHYEEYAQPPTKKPYVTTPSGSHVSIKFNDQPESYEINDLLRPDKDTSLQKDSVPEGHQKLVHYSVTPGLDIIDPNKQGTGAKGQENKQGVPDVRASYWYKSGTEPESVVTQGQKSIYTKTLTPDHKIYDLATDPDQIGKKLYESSLQRQVNPGQVTRDELLGQIRDYGYHGFTNSKHPSMNNVVQLFHQHRPETEEPVTPKHFEDLRNRIYKSENLSKSTKTPSKFTGYKRLEQIKRDHGVMASGNEHHQDELDQAIIEAKMRDADKMVQNADRMQRKPVKKAIIDESVFQEDLDKAAPQYEGELHPNGHHIAKKHPSGTVMWHSTKAVADNNDRIINDPKKIQSLLQRVPESHRDVLAGMIKSVARDPNRHFVPTQDRGVQKLRARHIKSLIHNDPDITLDTSDPNHLKITRQSHSQGVNSGQKIDFSFKKGENLGKTEQNDRPGISPAVCTVWDGNGFSRGLYSGRDWLYFEKSRPSSESGN